MKRYARQPRPWQIDESEFPRQSNRIAQFNFLTRYAVLAPSSHNSQPWKFATKNYKLLLLADLSRWLRVADADRRELYISLGCALENLLIAAAHFGYACNVEYFPEPDDDRVVARVELVPPTGGSLHHPELFDAITMRHTNRRPYESSPLSPEHVRHLRACCGEEDISLGLRGDGIVKAGVDELVQHADAIQFADPEYRKELARWIGEGAFGAPWPAARINEVVVSHFNVGGAVARKDSSALRSAPFVGLLSSVRDNRLSQVKVGQVFERMALTASMLSIRLQPMSQVLEVPELRTGLAGVFDISGDFPQHLFRVGYAATVSRRTPRRQLEEAWA